MTETQSQEPFDPDTQDELQGPKKRRLLTPFTCCLGCGGIAVLLIGGIVWLGFYLYNNALEDNPLNFTMTPVSVASITSAENKVKSLDSGEAGEISFSVDEINALIQKKLLPEIAKVFEADPKACKAVCNLTPGGKIDLKLSFPLYGKYCNLDFLGKASIKSGNLIFSDVDHAKIGKIDSTEKLRSLVAQVKKSEHDISFIKEAAVENGMVNIKAEVKKTAEKKQDVKAKDNQDQK